MNLNRKPDAGALRKAQDYRDKDAVYITSVEDTGEYRIVKGKVTCDFGFVHYPIVAMQQADEDMLLLASDCDCYESNRGESVCSHCLALVTKEGAAGNLYIAKMPGMELRGAQSRDRTDSIKLKIDEDMVREDGTRVLKARSTCKWGFVHYPSLLLREGSLLQYTCDCRHAMTEKSPCEHCLALQERALSRKDV